MTNQIKEAKCRLYGEQLAELKRDMEKYRGEVEAFFRGASGLVPDEAYLREGKQMLLKGLRVLNEDPALDEHGLNLLGRIARERDCCVFDTFQNGIAILFDGDGKFYVGRDGNELFNGRRFESAEPFSVNVAVVRDGDGLFYINNKGEEICGGKRFCDAKSFCEGKGIVIDERGCFWIGEDGKEVMLKGKRFERVESKGAFKDGCIAVKDSDGWFFVDENGKDIFKRKKRFDSAFNFNEGLACVSKNRFSSFFIDKRGRAVPWSKKVWFEKGENFKEGFARVWAPGGSFLIDKNGKELLGKGKRFWGLSEFYEGYASVADEGGWYFVDQTGKDMLDCKRFKEVDCFSEGLTTADDGEGYFYIDKLGRDVFNKRFKYACEFKNGIAYVRTEHDVFYINKRGKRVFGSLKWQGIGQMRS